MYESEEMDIIQSDIKVIICNYFMRITLHQIYKIG
jgi:hypothetical protein